MLPCTGDFATAIRESARDINVVIAYKSGDNFVFLAKDNIQSLAYNAKTEKGLGGIVKKVCDIKAMYNDYTAVLTKGMPINLYYKCGTGNCKKALLYINSVKTNKDKSLITIEALDYFSLNKANKHLPIMKNCDLKTYESAIFTALGYKYTIDDNVANPQLTLAYPKSGQAGDVLNEIAIANNAIIDFEEDIKNYVLTLPFELTASFSIPMVNGYIQPGDKVKIRVKKFAFKMVVDDEIDEDTEIITYDLDEAADSYNDVKVNLFFPGTSGQKSLGKANVTVPSATLNYDAGRVDFGNTMIPQFCSFTGKVDIVDYLLGPTGCAFTIDNHNPNAQSTEIEFFGFDINETTLSGTDTDNNIKQISNLYIQSPTAYNTDIFKGLDCTLKTFGNPLLEVGDTIAVGNKTILILEETLAFNGGLKSTLKGVVKNV